MVKKSTPNTNILLVSESGSNADALKSFLSAQGYMVQWTTNQSEAVKLLNGNKFHITLTGINLTDGNGYALCRYIKDNHNIPVIFLSAKSSEQHVVTAFDMGADDFVSIPFRERELASRIQNALRKVDYPPSVLTYKNISVDTVKGQVTKNGKEVYLSSLEYRILLVFMSNQGIVLSREKLLESVWAVDGSYINDNTLTVYIKRIREKLEDTPSNPQFIKTVRGKGYRTGE